MFKITSSFLRVWKVSYGFVLWLHRSLPVAIDDNVYIGPYAGDKCRTTSTSN